MTFGGVLNNVLAMEAAVQLSPVGANKKEDDHEDEENSKNEEEEEVTSELVS